MKAFGRSAGAGSTSFIRKSWRGSHLIGPRLPSKLKELKDPARRWRQIADEIHAEVCGRGFDPDLNSFVQAYEIETARRKPPAASARRLSSAADPRINGTLQAIEDRLLIDNEFVLRYEAENTGDGLPAGEEVFLACSFWLVDNYILQGRYAEARKLFDRLLSRCNDVGLLAEELDPLTGRMLGNFPQAYSHVGLINCALNLSRQTGPAEERSEILGLRYHHSSRPPPCEFSHV